jgi:hypothetical protein
MFDPAPSSTATTITDVLVWIRELSVIGIFLTVSWKARGAYDDAMKFVERIEQHMTKMENFAETAIENHMSHMQEALDKIAEFGDEKNDGN